MMSIKGFRYLDHPSDIGVEVEGESMEDLFLIATQAMLSVISDRDKAEGEEEVAKREIHLEEKSRDELLHSYLSEILWLVFQEGFFPVEIEIDSIGENSIDAVLSGVSINQEDMKSEIKAVTYHQLKIQLENGKLFTRIIFDV